MSARVPVEEHPADAAAGLWRSVHALADGLTEDQWGLPTPCAGWSVQDLLAHLGSLQTTLDGTAPQPERIDLPGEAARVNRWTEALVAARRGWTPAQVRGELESAASGQVARLRAVGDWQATITGHLGPTTELELYAIRCYDIWVHVQDLFEALDRPVATRDASPGARVAYGFVLHRVPWLYAKLAGAPEGAAMRFALGPPVDLDTALVVRDGRAAFDPDAEVDAAADALEADPGTLTLLVSGRRDPERWRAHGTLRWQGELAEKFVRRARFFG